MSTIEITINDVNYKSLGSFIDNQDGIDSYMPDENSYDYWTEFLDKSDPIIIMWALGALSYYGNDASEFRKSIIQAGSYKLDEFLEKYYKNLELENIFIDFIFDFSRVEFSTIYNEGKKMSPNDFNNCVFIENDKYERFIIDLNAVITTIKDNLKNDSR